MCGVVKRVYVPVFATADDGGYLWAGESTKTSRNKRIAELKGVCEREREGERERERDKNDIGRWGNMR